MLHLTVAVAAVFWSGLGSVSVDMDQAVYRVDLVNLAAPGPSMKAPQPRKAPSKAPKAEPAPEKPAPEPAQVKPAPAPKVPVPEAAKPRQVENKPLPKKAPPKPEAKPVARNTEKKPSPKPEQPEKKPEPQKPEPKKPEPKTPPRPSSDSVLANALKSVQTDVQQEQQREAQALDRELASLREQSGDIYDTGVEEGTETGGGGGGLSEVFTAIVAQQIKRNWRWPDYASNSNLVCVVELTIDAQGMIADSRLASTSGRPEFDNSALRAVKETEQVAQPPARRLQKVLVKFNSQELLQ